jgi:SAM-dependent methyltransferase
VDEMSHHRLLDAHILSLLPNCLEKRVILDIACGFGEWGYSIRKAKDGFPYIVGVDIWRPYLGRLRCLKIYDGLVRSKIPLIPIREKSVDISLACEILEHLPKHAGYELLSELERITRKTIIVSFPLNLLQGEVGGNPFERHVSQWLPEELIFYGYETKTLHTFSGSLEIADIVTRAILRMPPTPRFIVGIVKRAILRMPPTLQFIVGIVKRAILRMRPTPRFIVGKKEL